MFTRVVVQTIVTMFVVAMKVICNSDVHKNNDYQINCDCALFVFHTLRMFFLDFTANSFSYNYAGMKNVD